LDHEQARANVARLQGSLDSRRLPRRERREKEAELARWRLRHAAAAKVLDDLVTPEHRRLDRAEAKLAGRLGGLGRSESSEPTGFADHPDAACRLDGIERDVETLSAVVHRHAPAVSLGRGPSRDWPWLRDAPAIDRGLGLGL
ncbi:MAG TPA: hypothetical protein VNT52_13775, partial [Acidimicrobiales bacterium]|nr:hypothetical protein [Acidimicrobiales bacterium]